MPAMPIYQALSAEYHPSQYRYQPDYHLRTYEDWFTATVANAAKLYEYHENLGDARLNGYQYVYDFSPMLEEQLLLGGLRLAHVLNSIF